MPIVLSDTTLNMGINTLKPTPRATVYVVPLLEMPAVLQNSIVTWKLISVICLQCKLTSHSLTLLNHFLFNYNYNYNCDFPVATCQVRHLYVM